MWIESLLRYNGAFEANIVSFLLSKFDIPNSEANFEAVRHFAFQSFPVAIHLLGQ